MVIPVCPLPTCMTGQDTDWWLLDWTSNGQQVCCLLPASLHREPRTVHQVDSMRQLHEPTKVLTATARQTQVTILTLPHCTGPSKQPQQQNGSTSRVDRRFGTRSNSKRLQTL